MEDERMINFATTAERCTIVHRPRETLTATPTPQLGQGQRCGGFSYPCETGRGCKGVNYTAGDPVGTEYVGTVAVPARAPAAVLRRNAAGTTNPPLLERLAADIEYSGEIGVGAGIGRSDSVGSGPNESVLDHESLVDLIDQSVGTDYPVFAAHRTFALSPRSAESRNLYLWIGYSGLVGDEMG
ncbi:unnamed protein product [Euphydryas editha]|uniref:Uncharacterized protein n=1 Tax=Euphydryas editha TaxID=104508 RepID=A0AAU9UF86_EUPED|nr:unnamed protein product [Euphydryas editha]